MEINGQKLLNCQEEHHKILGTNGELYEIERYLRKSGVLERSIIL